MSHNPKHIQSVDRSLTIVDTLAKAGEPGLSLGEVSRDVGLNSSTVHHLLATLIYRQVVEQDTLSKNYRLGIHLIELGNAAKNSTSLTRLAKPFVEAAWETTKQGTSLLIFHGLVRTPILGLDSQRIFTAQRAPLEPTTLHATGSGKLLLAFLPEGDLEDYLQQYRLERFTANTISNRETLFTELEQIRQRGFALDCEEYGKGVRCISAPVQDATRRMAGCIDVVYPVSDNQNEQVEEWIKVITRNAAELSQKLRDFDLIIR
jgi:DNA-binding IclR family transcriptional regulator